MSGSVVQDDEEGHLIFKLGDVIQSRCVDQKIVSFMTNFKIADTR